MTSHSEKPTPLTDDLSVEKKDWIKPEISVVLEGVAGVQTGAGTGPDVYGTSS